MSGRDGYLPSLSIDEKELHKLARDVFDALYSSDTRSRNELIKKQFQPNAVFEDPLLFVEGRENIILHFQMLSWIFTRINAKAHRVTETVLSTPVSVAHADGHVIMIEADIEYGLPFRQTLAVRTISCFKFDHDRRIKRHENVWSLKDLVRCVPLVGWLYAEVTRKAAGIVTTQLVQLAEEISNTWDKLGEKYSGAHGLGSRKGNDRGGWQDPQHNHR